MLSAVPRSGSITVAKCTFRSFIPRRGLTERFCVTSTGYYFQVGSAWYKNICPSGKTTVRA